MEPGYPSGMREAPPPYVSLFLTAGAIEILVFKKDTNPHPIPLEWRLLWLPQAPAPASVCWQGKERKSAI